MPALRCSVVAGLSEASGGEADTLSRAIPFGFTEPGYNEGSFSFLNGVLENKARKAVAPLMRWGRAAGRGPFPGMM